MILGALRIKNEARWIQRVLNSIAPVCEHIFVMDDHSTDGTRELCAALDGVTVLDSPFEGLNEARDKNWLLDQIAPCKPEWLLMIDGDELLPETSIAPVLLASQQPYKACDFAIKYLWDTEQQIRVDGVYSRFRRPSMFRFGRERFETTGAAGNFHCGNVPLALQRHSRPIGASLLHLGYLHREDRIRKYEWYRSIDAKNHNEDGYRHMVVGDVFPATAAFRWGGPLKLEAIA